MRYPRRLKNLRTAWRRAHLARWTSRTNIREQQLRIRSWLQQWNTRQYGSAILFLVGLVLCLYAGGSYLWMYAQQRSLQREWQALNRPGHAADADANSPADLTRLVIPKIDLDVVVVEGTSSRSLMLGPGHLDDTALPGTAGNAVIAAHRDTFFRHVHELNPGDDIFIERDGRKYHYVVTGKRVVLPTDLSVLKPTSTEELTLITCYPTYYIGPAPKRLVVFATMSKQT